MKKTNMAESAGFTPALREVRRAWSSYNNGRIEAERYPHGKVLSNFKADTKRLERALWEARDDLIGLIDERASL